jgi:NADPH-dependent 2,4-dienoyl-CoA reductase/sulfur reductase-like enzyme/nitrite reductase/ring-hydroxylating ferredoxin subunit
MGEATGASGPDFSQGIDLQQIPNEGTIAGRVGDEPVLLSRLGGELFAVGGACTHYGGRLGDGTSAGATVRCPLHHACFDLSTGAALRAPALDPLDRWQVEIRDGRAFVTDKLGTEAKRPSPTHGDVRRIVIVGGGAAGLACADQLRKLGFDGEVTIVSADGDPPCDRPNLSKDYLAGKAPEEWLWLRGSDWYAEHRIELRLGTEVTGVDAAERVVKLSSGERIAFDRLLIATGCEPNRLQVPGFDRPEVHVLRSVGDARAIAEKAQAGARVAIIGASFIALEAAAALRQRGVQVDIISVEEVPLERVFGKEIGRGIQNLHERNGVRFHLSSVVGGFDGRSVSVANGKSIDSDFVLVGIGVQPRTAVAQMAGARVDNGVVVDAFLETAVPGVFAAGDIASYPDPGSGERVRIEHWVTAERQGQVAAANMLGARERSEAVPFFWTEQFGTTIRYVGRAAGWDTVALDGDFASQSLIARYFADGVHCATATVGRDSDNLEDELAFEARIHSTEVCQ